MTAAPPNLVRLCLDPWKREVAKITKLSGGAVIVEPMRFMTHGEAKLIAKANAPRRSRKVSPASDWQSKARTSSQCLCEAIERAGVRP